MKRRSWENDFSSHEPADDLSGQSDEEYYDGNSDDANEEEDSDSVPKDTTNMTAQEELEYLTRPVTNKFQKSSFTEFQEQMNKQIHLLENENIAPKPWTLTGEVSNQKRPQNSLLEEVLEFDQRIKPVPIITEQLTSSLEDIIKKRIQEAAWDDPYLPSFVKAPSKQPALPELSTSRSKESLSAIYEKQYSQQVMGISSTDPLAPQKRAIEALWKKLEFSIDQLSHFHYTPKPPPREDMDHSERPNVSTVLLEEAMPNTMNLPRDTKAPQELFRPLKGSLKDTSELSREERHSKHLQKKRLLRKKAQQDLLEKQRMLLSSSSLSKRKESKLMKETALKSLSNQRNVTIISDKRSSRQKKTNLAKK